jgi:hypothetical protein
MDIPLWYFVVPDGRFSLLEIGFLGGTERSMGLGGEEIFYR